MKRYRFLFLLLAALSMTSCLDEHPKDQLDEDAIYGSASDIYINAVASLYNYIGGANESEGIQGTCRGIYDYNTLTTDEAMIPIRGGDWYDGGLWNAMYQHRWTADDQSLYDTWKYIYKVIVLANKSLDIISSKSGLLSAAQQQEYRAEVRAIRAMFYYYAMDMFGRVPLVLSTDEQRYSSQFQGQTDRSSVFHFVFQELQQVLPSLPDQHSNKEGNYYGRITQPVVNFLLAKLALNAEIYMYDDWTQGYANRPKGSDIHFSVPAADASSHGGDKELNAWETCIYYCDKLAEEGYVLESDDAFNFSTHNETSKENIFTIPMDKNIYTNQFHYLFRSYHYTHGGVLGWGSENGTCATISTMKANHYGEADEDARCKMNFVAGVVKVDGHELLMDNGKPLEYQPFEVAQNLTNSKFVKTAGARMAKYEVDRTSYMDGKLQSNDIVLFRYADALLMKAEAKVRNGENGDEELNRIRARVGMPYRKATLDNILEERLLELVWEGWRRQDLIRFGKFTGAYDLRTPLQGESSGYTTVFPIPQKCIDLNSELVQNKGYVNILK
ncbi:RagB/SusD family nutrient uptake outer membrane protein [Segatella copri]|uniref:RagB/SusD family nutrient uptake outer membrane protein n=1 Tax=Segatella copri TaxID=165179 RepID=UPI0025D30BCF|nr:RagB/SusD family nutrient uptake outer membrane protein [Segatella copri]MDV3106928.1 RagB/SusD family nutrient uptake outer membrane protein [Segatella copri]MDV3113448.1 RagB/SusD family nutrient uptake outer membrane protein [Segatella copri]WOF87019.1 RagB/SusD family nutrient uptake outer membrane protein [Segatella copri]WOF93250.1 RagB/SusD family nutrient uptake outer membrane protein [Segatella copri]